MSDLAFAARVDTGLIKMQFISAKLETFQSKAGHKRVTYDWTDIFRHSQDRQKDMK